MTADPFATPKTAETVQASASGASVVPMPTLGEAAPFWLWLGCVSFGGPSGQIAIMHTELVEKRRWISEERFLHALNYCMLLPGPEATQLATYCGWLLHGTRGGILAGACFVLPAILALWLLSVVYVQFGHVPALNALFNGVKPAVIAIVVCALWRIGSRALKTRTLVALAALAFVALFFFHAPYPAVMAGAAMIGFLLRKKTSASPPLAASEKTAPPLSRSLNIIGVCLVLWWGPVLACAALFGWSHVLTQQGLFFSKAALVTFGGAYAVLPYVGQQAVSYYGWISPTQMLDGLGLAETTPGPLIMVLQFFGFLGAWQQPHPLSPLTAATCGALLTTWVTFVPSFLFIFLGAPYIERLRSITWLNDVLASVTAAVVGVILNLAVWFTLQVVYPHNQRVDWLSLLVAVAGVLALQRFKAPILAVIGACAGLGLLQGIL